MVVEDDAGMRQAIERLLQAAGYSTAALESAEALLEAGAAAGAGCLVLDIRLPGFSGCELSARLAEDGGAPPVIFMTAHDEPAARAAAERAGGIAYLPKPFAGRMLLDAVARALGP